MGTAQTPNARSKAAMQSRWDRQRQDTAQWQAAPPKRRSRADELADIARFIAERGVTHVAPQPSPGEGAPSQQRPQPMPGWR